MADPFSTEELAIGAVSRLAGAADPRAGGGVAAAIGSIYFRTNGQAYTKTGAGNTAWTALGAPLQTVVVTGAATDTIAFTGLNGDLDQLYFLQSTIFVATGAGTYDIRVEPNGAAAANGATVGFFYDFLTSGTDQVTEWNLWRLITGAAGDVYNCTGWIWAQTGKPRTSFAQQSAQVTGGREVEGRIQFSKWNESVTNITSLELTNPMAIFDVGTRVSISKIPLG